jgi:hypothetical protein
MFKQIILFTFYRIECHNFEFELKNDQYEHHPQAAAHGK